MKLLNVINRFRLRDEKESPEYVLDAINSGIEFRGTNLIILIFAIIIASVGLNVNSTAVIIGAMLISPLMGPIIGLGYSMATYDFLLLKKSLKNLSFAIVTSLFASTVYFALSPLNEAHSELLARTTPTIYDVLIALFGGFAGIVATASKKKGNVIPGAAIATALMPPLCTAGYGIATAQWNFFLGAMYLFNINTVFIALSTMVFTRFLKYPFHHESDEKRILKTNRWLTLIVVVTILPSIYLGYRFIMQDQFIRNANAFIQSEAVFENSYLLKHNIDPSTEKISLVFGGKELTQEQRNQIKSKLVYFKLEDVQLDIIQGFSIEDESKSFTRMEKFYNDIKSLERQNRQLVKIKDSLENYLGAQQVNRRKLKDEIKVLFPEIGQIAIEQEIFEWDSIRKTVNIVFVESRQKTFDRTKFKNWLKTRLDSDSIRLITN